MELSGAMQTALESGSIAPRWVLLLSGRNRSTGATERIGFWTGDDTRTITIGGTAWVCYAGAILGMSPPECAAGLEVRTQRFTMFAGTPAVVDAIRLYDASLAPAEMHLALMDPGGGQLIGTAPVFLGYVDAAPIDEAAGTCELSLVSDVQAGTGRSGLRKSDASLKLRDPDDTGNEYADVAGSVPVVWGADHVGAYVVPRPGG